MSNVTSVASSQSPHVLPTNLTLGAVELIVTDLDRSVDFYERAIGLKLTSRNSGKDAVARLGAGADDLLVLHERPDARPQGRHAGLYHFALLHPTRQELARAVRRLAETETPIQGASDHGISEAIYLPDPDGNGIELAADQPRENWGNLRDPTTIGPAPLDMAGMLETVAGEDLSPLADNDLQVGHLHLHVGDVEEGLAFYRDLVGFEVQTLFEGAAFVSAGGYHHHLGINTWRGEGVPPAPTGAIGLDHWTVVIDSDSLGDLRHRFAAAGVALEETDGGLLAQDPWDTQVLFIGR